MAHELDVEQLIHKSGMPRDLGVEFVDFSPIRVVAAMPVDDRHLQPLGFLHGGVSVTLAESVATVGAWLNGPPEKMALGSAINANHLKPKRPGGRLVAVGIPDYVNSEKQVWEVDVRDESDERVCVARCTLTVIDLVQNTYSAQSEKPSDPICPHHLKAELEQKLRRELTFQPGMELVPIGPLVP